MADTLNALLIFGGDASGAIKAVQSLNKNIDGLSQKVNNLNRQMSQAGKAGGVSFGGVANVFKNLFGVVQRTIDGFRLMTQGLMSIGRATLFFVSLPLGMALKNAATFAIDYNAQLVRVRKTAGLTTDELQQMDQAIRAIAARAPSSHQELGLMAEQAGQLGVKGPKAIAELVEWMEILAQSTNISGEEVVSVMGKIANAFGWNLTESRQEIIRLSNVMNQLENDTASTAQEIADALFRFAPVAKQLDIASYDAAALAAALISVGVSAESAGTRLGTMFIKLTQNADKFADLAKNTDKYATKADVMNAINEDAVSVLFDLITMMRESDSRADALASAFDIVGLRGGRALGALTSGQEAFTNAMRTARVEWVEASSLLIEYNRQLESTQAQLGILRNNVNNVSLSIGDALLPTLNELIQLLVPGVRKLIAWMDAMEKAGKSVKLWIVGIALAAVVFGPLVFMLSQVVFGITMFFLGILKLVGALASAVWFIGTFVGGLLTLSSSAWIAAAAIVAGAFAIMKALQNTGRDIASFFTDLAARAAAWGDRLASEYAGGFVAGAAKYIAAAITWVANLIASFLEGHSPPDVGPLSHIDKWGKTVIDAYLKGMQKADFSILRSIGRTIDGILSNLAKSKVIGDRQHVIMLMQARQDLAKLLKNFRETGKISEGTLNQIVKGLGDAADEVKQLIRYELELLAIQERLKELEERRQQTVENYGQEIEDIAASGASAAERVALIRKAMRARNDELKSIAKEEKELEKQKTVAEEQLETQRAMIEAMQEQDDIQARLIKAMEKLASAAGEGGAFEFPEVDASGVSLPDIDELLDEIGTPVIELEAKIKSKAGIWDAFLAGLRGEDIGVAGMPEHLIPSMFGVSEEDADTFWTLYDLGYKINDTWGKTVDLFNNLRETITGFELSGEVLPPEVQDKLDTFSNWWQKTWPIIQALALTGWEILKSIWNTAVALIGPKIEELREAFGKLTAALESQGVTWGDIARVIGIIFGAALLGLIGIVTAVVGAVIDWITILIEAWATLTDRGSSFGERLYAFFVFITGGLLHLIGAFIDNILFWLAEMYANLTGSSVNAWERIKSIFLEGVSYIVNNVITFFTNLFTGIKNLLTKGIQTFMIFWTNVVRIFISFLAAIITRVITWGRTLFSNISKAFRMIWTIIVVLWNAIKVVISNVSQNIRNIILNFLIYLVNIVTTKFGQLRDKAKQKIEDLRNKIRDWATKLKQNFTTWGSEMIQNFADAIRKKIQAVVNAAQQLYNRVKAKLQPLIDIWNRVKNIGKGRNNDDEPEEGAAGGGTTFGGRGFVVGEEGWEWFQPGTFGQIINQATLGKLFSTGDNDQSGGGIGQLILNFNADSVRSEEDIYRIANIVREVIDSQASLDVLYGAT